MSQQLKQNFTLTGAGLVWKMLTDQTGRYLVTEFRDQTTREVHFSAVDLVEQAILWEGLTFENSWWTAATAVEEQVVLFHTYEDSYDPDQKVFFAVDLHQVDILWQQAGFHFKAVGQGVVSGYLKNGPDEQHVAIGLGSGQFVENIPAIERENKKNNKNVDLPFHYTAEMPHFETVKRFVQGQYGHDMVGACDYMEVNDLIVISYFTGQPKNMANYLLVMASNGQPVNHECIGTALAGWGMDTFFVAHNQLIFVRNQNEIISYGLS